MDNFKKNHLSLFMKIPVYCFSSFSSIIFSCSVKPGLRPSPCVSHIVICMSRLNFTYIITKCIKISITHFIIIVKCIYKN